MPTFVNPSIPTLDVNHIYRPRIVGKLNKGLTRKLIVLTAPAGYGKTALLSEWALQLSIPVIWLSMGTADNNVDRTYARFNAAMSQVFPEFKVQLPDSMTPIVEADIYESVFMEKLHALEREFVVVLDNYHVVNNLTPQRVTETILDMTPPFMHWVYATRVAPPFPLTRLRVEGETLELDAHDLRFTHDEVETFFITNKGLYISPAGIDHLYEKTEGWIGLMQLAALSIGKRPSAQQEQYVNRLTAQSAYIQDYFSEEVLAMQSETVQEFLLKTSVLRKINHSLASYVLDGRDVTAMQKHLISCGLLIPVEGERNQYQYPYLFAHYLRTKFLELYGMSEMSDLHRQASVWYETKGFLADAVNHAFACMDTERATRLLNTNTQQTDLREHLTWQKWFAELPEDIQREYPDICFQCASACYLTKDFDSMNHFLQVAEQVWLAQNKQERLADINRMHSLQALYRQKYPEVVEYAARALPNTADSYSLGGVHHVLSAGLFYTGKTAEAERHVVKGRELLEHHDIYTMQIATGLLARVRAARGKLREAAEIHKQVSEYTDPKVYEQVVAAKIFLGHLYYEWNQLELAQTNLNEALGQSPLRYNGRHWPEAHVIKAKVLFAMGLEAEARAELCQAINVARRFENVKFQRLVRALGVRFDIRTGALLRAVQWEDQVPPINLKVSYDYELSIEYLTMARLVIARLNLSDDNEPSLVARARDLLEPIFSNALENGRIPEAIECHILKSRLYAAIDADDQALSQLEKALELAETEGYIRAFIDEGEPMRKLLSKVINRGIAVTYASRLLGEFGKYSSLDAELNLEIAPTILTERELDVLRLIAQGLTAKEIADRLVVSWHTVRTHTKNIYCKLEVHNSFQAVERAQLLNLV